jgi:hypothetical protein
MVVLSYIESTHATKSLAIPPQRRKLFIETTYRRVNAAEINEQAMTSMAKIPFTEVKRTFLNGPEIPSFTPLS